MKNTDKSVIKTTDVYKSIRRTWGGFDPVSRVVGNKKKKVDKKACRGKVKEC